MIPETQRKAALDQKQVVQGGRIRNDHQHVLQPKAMVGRTVAFQIFASVFELNAMLLEKAINLHPSLVAEQPPKLGGGEFAFAVSLESNSFKSGAGEVAPASG